MLHRLALRLVSLIEPFLGLPHSQFACSLFRIFLVALPMLVLYTFGIPLFGYYLMHKHRARLYTDERVMVRSV
jgi:hypothetical protein